MVLWKICDDQVCKCQAPAVEAILMAPAALFGAITIIYYIR